MKKKSNKITKADKANVASPEPDEDDAARVFTKAKS